jgi:hypothetical protein
LSLRNKTPKKKLTIAELENLRNQNNSQAQAELQGMSPEQASITAKGEETVFFKKGDSKGMKMKGGETDLVPLSEMDPSVGTETFIKYRDKNNQVKHTRTVITKDKRLLDESGNEIRSLY